ncbi:MAG: hypothetical protein GY730_04695 [bacterium]|uniref:hypothetical protein n=1 Tax=Pseudoalteromonas sp. bablab_jr010 TaxID=2755063 RepID=UPI0018F54A7A|nr:hypothetical protein [Pseudoalteromonas sp. bablab_jr010]MCP4049985.1 hypothetical protein [bacterium]
MDESVILRANILIDESSSNDLSWLNEDNSENYFKVDILGEDFSKVANDVFNIYKNVYTLLFPKLKLLFETPEALYDYNRWILFTNSDGKINGFCLLSVTDFGLKSCLLGADRDCNASKSSVVSFKKAMLNDSNSFGEVSGRLKKAIINDVPIVKVEHAIMLLESLGKSRAVPTTNENHYERELRNVGKVEKLMVGKPSLPESFLSISA